MPSSSKRLTKLASVYRAGCLVNRCVATTVSLSMDWPSVMAGSMSLVVSSTPSSSSVPSR